MINIKKSIHISQIDKQPQFYSLMYNNSVSQNQNDTVIVSEGKNFTKMYHKILSELFVYINCYQTEENKVSFIEHTFINRIIATFTQHYPFSKLSMIDGRDDRSIYLYIQLFEFMLFIFAKYFPSGTYFVKNQYKSRNVQLYQTFCDVFFLDYVNSWEMKDPYFIYFLSFLDSYTNCNFTEGVLTKALNNTLDDLQDSINKEKSHNTNYKMYLDLKLKGIFFDKQSYGSFLIEPRHIRQRYLDMSITHHSKLTKYYWDGLFGISKSRISTQFLDDITQFFLMTRLLKEMPILGFNKKENFDFYFRMAIFFFFNPIKTIHLEELLDFVFGEFFIKHFKFTKNSYNLSIDVLFSFCKKILSILNSFSNVTNFKSMHKSEYSFTHHKMYNISRGIDSVYIDSIHGTYNNQQQPNLVAKNIDKQALFGKLYKADNAVSKFINYERAYMKINDINIQERIGNYYDLKADINKNKDVSKMNYLFEKLDLSYVCLPQINILKTFTTKKDDLYKRENLSRRKNGYIPESQYKKSYPEKNYVHTTVNKISDDNVLITRSENIQKKPIKNNVKRQFRDISLSYQFFNNNFRLIKNNKNNSLNTKRFSILKKQNINIWNNLKQYHYTLYKMRVCFKYRVFVPRFYYKIAQIYLKTFIKNKIPEDNFTISYILSSYFSKKAYNELKSEYKLQSTFWTYWFYLKYFYNPGKYQVLHTTPLYTINDYYTMLPSFPSQSFTRHQARLAAIQNLKRITTIFKRYNATELANSKLVGATELKTERYLNYRKEGIKNSTIADLKHKYAKKRIINAMNDLLRCTEVFSLKINLKNDNRKDFMKVLRLYIHNVHKKKFNNDVKQIIKTFSVTQQEVRYLLKQ